MHKAGWNGKRSSLVMCLAWFVFERGHPLQPVLKRIRCRPREAIGADCLRPDDWRRAAAYATPPGRGHWWW
jgi:hypothetical protein